MSDFRALTSFIDQVVKAAQPINEGSKDYFFAIIDPQELDELGRETWHAYKAAEDEIQHNVSQLNGRKEEFISYLNEVKAFMDEPSLFRSMVIEGSEFVAKGLIKPNGNLSTTERAAQQINHLITEAWDLDPITGLNAGSGQLSSSSKKYIAFLRLYEAGAYEGWKRIEATIARHVRNAKALSALDRGRPEPSNFDLESFPNEVGLEVPIDTVDHVLTVIEAIKRKPGGTWEIKKWAAKGHPFIAVMRLLIYFRKTDDTTHGKLQSWVDFFEHRYGVVISVATSRLQLSKENSVFQVAITKSNTALIHRFPLLKPGYKAHK